MSDKQKSLGSKFLGLFVEREGEETAQAEDGAPDGTPSGDPVADDLIARYAGGAPAKRVASSAAADAAADSDATPVTSPQVQFTATGQVAPAQLDFPNIYKKKGLSAEEQAHVERALTLLANLPKETPQEIKRQIVGASLLAFGVPVDRILESAMLQLRALDLHVQEGQRETQSFLEESTRRLRELEQESARVKKIAEEQLAHQGAVAAAVGEKKTRVEEVLAFFGTEAADRVRAASSRLRD